tara:strand:+ start:1527 stop:1733 length:207 start_codon:yes stop_codon:yes gene_type:complete
MKNKTTGLFEGTNEFLDYLDDFTLSLNNLKVSEAEIELKEKIMESNKKSMIDQQINYLLENNNKINNK